MSFVVGILLSILVFTMYFLAYYYLVTTRKGLLGKIIVTVIIATILVISLIIGFLVVFTKVAIENQLQCQKNIVNWCRTVNFYEAIAFCNTTAWYVYYGVNIFNNTAHVYVECDNKTFGYINDMFYFLTVKCEYYSKSDKVECNIVLK